MPKQHKPHSPARYRIRLQECLDHKWSDWFEEVAISSECGKTILTGRVVDQAALHGLLIQIRDLNLTLLSVERLQPGREDSDRSKKRQYTKEER